jgi:hypothetical protein
MNLADQIIIGQIISYAWSSLLVSNFFKHLRDRLKRICFGCPTGKIRPGCDFIPCRLIQSQRKQILRPHYHGTSWAPFISKGTFCLTPFNRASSDIDHSLPLKKLVQVIRVIKHRLLPQLSSNILRLFLFRCWNHLLLDPKTVWHCLQTYWWLRNVQFWRPRPIVVLLMDLRVDIFPTPLVSSMQMFCILGKSLHGKPSVFHLFHQQIYFWFLDKIFNWFPKI